MDPSKHMLNKSLLDDRFQKNNIEINSYDDNNPGIKLTEEIRSIIDNVQYKVNEADVYLNAINMGTLINGEIIIEPGKPNRYRGGIRHLSKSEEIKPHETKIRSIKKIKREL